MFSKPQEPTITREIKLKRKPSEGRRDKLVERLLAENAMLQEDVEKWKRIAKIEAFDVKSKEIPSILGSGWAMGIVVYPVIALSIQFPFS